MLAFSIIIPISMRLRVRTNRMFSGTSEFKFIRQIGVGSFGCVRLALHAETSRCYAVKVVDLAADMSQNQLLLLEREINLHSAMDHPHIIKLWDTLIEQETVYMVMELAENGTLFSYQNNHRNISQVQAYKFFSQTASAIRYLHEHDIMHRDIKPENILLDAGNNVKLCDMGWATDNIHQKRRTFCGTYEYMAPEMVFQQEYDCAIDYWALGILLFELLHGCAPFAAKTLPEMQQKVKLGYYELGSNLSKEAKQLIIDILQFDAAQRPSLSEVAKHAWMKNMQEQIVGQLGDLPNSLAEQQMSDRAKVMRSKVTSKAKKHKRYDSIVCQKHESSKRLVKDQAWAKVGGEQKQRRAKKKCKTQGEQSMEKLFTDSTSKIWDGKGKNRAGKQNSKGTDHITKPIDIAMNKQASLSNLKMRRIADKLNQMASKYPAERRRPRVQVQNWGV